MKLDKKSINQLVEIIALKVKRELKKEIKEDINEQIKFALSLTNINENISDNNSNNKNNDINGLSTKDKLQLRKKYETELQFGNDFNIQESTNHKPTIAITGHDGGIINPNTDSGKKLIDMQTKDYSKYKKFFNKKR